LSRSSKLWLAAAFALLAGQSLAALLLPRGFVLTAISDSTQCLLLLCGTLVCLPNVRASRGRIRIFWLLMTVGLALWLAYQLVWNYFEIYLRQDVPDLFLGDVLMFLHIVPMMAALALEPQRAQDDRAMRFNSLDFALLLVWWLYLYCFSVIPWLEVFPDVVAYNHTQNQIYTVEKVVFLGLLALIWKRSAAGWRVVYAQLFGASFVYALSSYLANWAIGKGLYYTGSLYDLPLVLSMTWFTAVALLARDLSPRQEPARTGAERAVWIARLAMITIFSLPLFAAWTLLDPRPPASVRNFRLLLTLGTMIVMGAMVFLKQHLLDRELLSLLQASQDAFENLRRLHAQLLQSEKLASLGQLVGGAAHQLNNPITAMSGYSELLTASNLSDEDHSMAENIGQQVRRVRGLVANLLSFAKSVPGDKAALDISSIVQTAINLWHPPLLANKIELRCDLATDLPQVLGDANQLLQVCLHILNSAMYLLREAEGGKISVSTRAQASQVILEFGLSEPASLAGQPGSFAAGGTSRLGLSACSEIVREHKGTIGLLNQTQGCLLVRIELPCAGQVSMTTSSRAQHLSQAVSSGRNG
jgi:signal transduction histidine kinase